MEFNISDFGWFLRFSKEKENNLIFVKNYAMEFLNVVNSIKVLSLLFYSILYLNQNFIPYYAKKFTCLKMIQL